MNDGDAFIKHLAALEKAQTVRLWDVFALGPAMIVAGGQIRSKPLGSFIALAGLGTILYNGANYVRIEQLKRANNGRT